MSGQEIRSPQAASIEGAQDARSIQLELNTDSTSAYQMFRRELDDVDTNVKDVNLRGAYQENLLRTLGESNVNALMIEYLNDPKGGADLRKQGQISRLALAEKRAKCDAPGALSAVDKVLLPQLSLSFDNLRNGDMKDGDNKKNSDSITDEDLRAFRGRFSSDRFTNSAVKMNRSEKFADSLLDPTRSEIFDRIETSDDLPFTRKDGKISRSNLREFMEDAAKYKKSDKEFKYPPDLMQSVQFMHDNWDSPQVRMLRDKDGKGYMTRDSIARGCGYPGGYSEYVEKYKQERSSRIEFKPDTSQRERIVKDITKPEEKTPVQSIEEFKKSKLSVLAKQETMQGYWQVGAKLLKESPAEKETPQETSRQNIILMRALQNLHRQQGGKLGGHEFLASPKDFDSLKSEIDKYAQSRSERTRASAEALKKRLEKLRAN
ncbi:MAG: hypothetical protein K2Y39_20375 [Candidatus Obscuribacterales bacterium]|nr:hypothetical protein [Candidatus Obscuribacterales bacterium]